MNKFIAILVLVAGFIGAIAPRTLADPPRVTGRVLVLKNERTITGEIELMGTEYRIKRLIGETMIPASQVLKLCDSLEDAYQYLKTRANLNDPDERMRLFDWCRQHALRERACEEIEAATKLQPKNPRYQRLAKHYRESLEQPEQPTQPAMPVEEPSGPPVEVSTESLSLFATKVQPILMNTCACCHTAGRGGNFQLMRVSGPGLASRKSLEKNLAAVLAHVNGKQPLTSKFLTKAISIHGPGMTQAPIRGRRAAPYKYLEHWVLRTAMTNPHLRDDVPATATASASSSVDSDTVFGADRMPMADSILPAQQTPKATATPMTPPTPQATATPMTTTRPEAKPKEAKPASVDPVDPESFNREFHPRPKTETPVEKPKN